MLHRVAVFCGSRKGGRSLYADHARLLGRELAGRGLELVFGGGHIGLMGVLADAVLEARGRAIGVIPQSLVDRELAHTSLTVLDVVDTMHQRKERMADLADGFIALPGGFGTADEMFEILTWAQLGLHQKPIGLLNSGGFFDPLLAWLDQCVTEDFLKADHRGLLQAAAEPIELLDRLLRFRPSIISPKGLAKEDR